MYSLLPRTNITLAVQPASTKGSVVRAARFTALFTRRAGHAGGCFRPLLDVIPHVVVTGEEALPDGPENPSIVGRLRPEVVLLENVLTEMLTSELCRFLATVPVEYAEVSQRDRTLLIRRIQALQGDGIGVL